MIRKKTLRNGKRKYLYNITTTTLILYLTTTEISCCVVTPREFLTTVGEVVSLGCSSRPNNEQQGTLTNLKLENEDKSETLVFRNPVYDRNGKIETNQFVADEYFLLSKSELINATIQINETQLKHGGRYVCSCSTDKAPTGSGNLVILDKLSFVKAGDKPLSPGEPTDLNCSFSFSGSISSAVSVDLTIQDANGTELTAKKGLSLSWRSQGGSHHVNYSFITQRNLKEQIVTCQMKVWNQSTSEKQLLRSMTANYILNADVTPSTVSKVTAAVVTVSVLVVMVLLVVIVIYMIRRKRRTYLYKSNSSSFVAHKSSTPTQSVRYEGVKSSIEHPTEDKKQKNKMCADDEVFVFENEIYDASSGCIVPTEDKKQNKNKTGEDGEVFVFENEIYDVSSGCIAPIAKELPL